ncbi:MAG: hypothetical protein FJ225_00670 [Lentisphaerae bacterium]|nr:hypothetical protein [Lentisphaerota bacterium]
MKRVLILYAVQNSGHHAAARCLERAFRAHGPDIAPLCIDLLQHTHPRWNRIVERMYMTTIRRTPELWDALYDNFWVEFLTRRVRQIIQKGGSASLQRLMADFDPDAVVCTQAYPLAVITNFVSRRERIIPLFGVTTDYVPHRFWINHAPNVHYVVPIESAAARLMWLGIGRERVRVFGIPVTGDGAPAPDPPARPSEKRRVLAMGGSRGMGVLFRTVRNLDRSPAPFTIDVVCGTNNRLRRRLLRNRRRFSHPIRIRGYVRDAARLMPRADLMLTKAGGLTLAEAACAGLPLLLLRPLPGQERQNTAVMVHHGAALQVESEHDVARSVTALLGNGDLLRMMRAKARALARPDAAARIVRHVLECIHDRPGTAT